MKRFQHTVLSVALLGGVLAVGPVRAQDAPPRPRLMLDIPMLSFGPARLGQIDPLYKQALGLLLRNDVRTALKMDAKQREAIEELEGKPGQPIRFEARASSHDENPSGETDPQKRVQDSLREQITKRQKESNSKAEGILRPEQQSRLNELDLQWRGPLAMANKDVAEAVELTQEQREKVQEAYRAYKEARMKAMADMMRVVTRDGNGGDNPPPPSTDGDGESRTEVSIVIAGSPRRGNGPAGTGRQMTDEEKAKEAKRTKTIEAARKEQGDKVLALLTSEQKKKWESLLGPAFTFRIAD